MTRCVMHKHIVSWSDWGWNFEWQRDRKLPVPYGHETEWLEEQQRSRDVIAHSSFVVRGLIR